jgi:hypothetical protein
MRRIARITVAAAIPLAALATAAQAQLAGIPVYFSPGSGTGVGIAANIGFPNTEAGGGTAYGVSGSLGTGPVTLTAMVGAWKASGGNYGWASAQTSYGGAIAYRLIGGGMLPVAVSVQAGYGMIKAPAVSLVPSYSITSIPVGVGISLDPPLFPFKPWIAPRIQFTNFGSGAPSTLSNTSNFAVSGGVNFNLLLGLGVHAAVDWQQQKIAGVTKTPLIWSVGAHFNFHVP